MLNPNPSASPNPTLNHNHSQFLYWIFLETFHVKTSIKFIHPKALLRILF